MELDKAILFWELKGYELISYGAKDIFLCYFVPLDNKNRSQCKSKTYCMGEYVAKEKVIEQCISRLENHIENDSKY